MNIGQNIKNIRELKNLTQEYVSKKLGIARSQYIKIESNSISLKLETLTILAEIFEVSIHDIIGFGEKNIFNTTHHNNNVKNVGNIINDFQHEEMKELYEKLLREKDEIIALLKQRVKK